MQRSVHVDQRPPALPRHLPLPPSPPPPRPMPTRRAMPQGPTHTPAARAKGPGTHAGGHTLAMAGAGKAMAGKGSPGSFCSCFWSAAPGNTTGTPVRNGTGPPSSRLPQPIRAFLFQLCFPCAVEPMVTRTRTPGGVWGQKDWDEDRPGPQQSPMLSGH
jgi:hypothetical protein